MSQVVQVTSIPVWPDRVPDADRWRDAGPELERPLWENSRLVRNVSQPTLTVYLPEPSTAVGTGVVVCPGGGFRFLMVDHEGSEVARWLNARGVAAFVLRYRLVPTPDDDDAFMQIAADVGQRRQQMIEVLPFAIADGLQAIGTLRQQARTGGISPDRLGVMGFSAGAVVAAGLATEYDAESRPSFAAPIYGGVFDERSVPADVPPLFLTAASNDEQVDVQYSLSLYGRWKAVGRSAELHLYTQGGHGFGMKRQGLPSDTWIDRFWDWLQAEGFVPAAAA